MQPVFNKNHYFDVTRCNETHLIIEMKNSLAFSNKQVDASYADFKANFQVPEKKHWSDHLLNSLFVGVIKTAEHLADDFQNCCIQTYRGKYDILKVKIFLIARDLQEAFGHITSIFNQTFGQYHIQQSRFYKTSYLLYAFNQNAATLDASANLTCLKNQASPKPQTPLKIQNPYYLSQNQLQELKDSLVDKEDEQKEAILLKLVQFHVNNSDLDEALSYVEEASHLSVCYLHAEFHDLHIQLFKLYQEKQDYSKAIRALSTPYTQEKAACFKEIIEDILNEKIYLFRAFHLISDNTNLQAFPNIKNDLYRRIAQSFINSNDMNSALIAIKEIDDNYGFKEFLLSQVSPSVQAVDVN